MCAPECRCPWKSEVANLPGASWSYRWLWPSQCEHTQFLIDDLRTPSSIFIYFFKIVLSLTHIIFLEYHIIFISLTPLMVMIFQNPCLSDLKDLCSISEVLFRLHLITMCLVLYLSLRGFLGGGSQEVQYHSHWRYPLWPCHPCWCELGQQTRGAFQFLYSHVPVWLPLCTFGKGHCMCFIL